MPDISHALSLLGASFFLYASEEDANKGQEFGGTGFIVGIPFKTRPDLVIRYAVTNWHVACQSGASVIRLNDPNGGIHIIDKDPSEWHFLPRKQDVAATLLQLPKNLGSSIIQKSLFIRSDDPGGVFAGDDIFMVGRFIDFDGAETNTNGLGR